MHEEDSTVQLISSRSFRRNGRARDYDKDELLAYSDTETGRSNKGDDVFEETTVFSDSLYGDSLPSMRAQLAATQMQHRKRKNEDLENSRKKESNSLLSKHDKDEETALSSTMLMEKKTKEPDNYGQYKSLGGHIVPKRKTNRESLKKFLKYFKVISLTLLMVVCVTLFAVNPEHEEEVRYITLRSNEPLSIDYSYAETRTWKFITLQITGPFLDNSFHNGTGGRTEDSCADYVFVCGVPSNRTTDNPCPNEGKATNCHSFQLAGGYNGRHPHENYTSFTKTLEIRADQEEIVNVTHSLDDHLIETVQDSEDDNVTYTIRFMSVMTEGQSVEFQATIIGETLGDTYQVIIAACILVWVYVLIAFDIVHRTMAAFIGSTCTLAVLSMIDKRPTLDEVVEWIDLDTICLLFGMMTLVGIFSQTGFFDYSAVKAYKLARGKVWPLITLLCLFSAVVSAFLDNVTTILLLTPVSIRLCQVLNLDPRPVLIAEVVFSNIGGTATAIGDPPNVIIISNNLIRSVGITFPEFTLHLFLGIIMAMVAAYGLLSLIYFVSFIRVKNKDPPHVAELKREVAIWERTAQRLNVVSLEERAVRDAILAKAMDVRNQLNQEVNVTVHSSKDMWQKNLAELESKYRITNWVLLIKSSVVLVVVIFMFFMSHIIPKVELGLGWIAIFGAVVLLLLSDIQDLESVLHKIEWGTLLFFAGLFILMEGLGELGLISFIGDTIVAWIKGVPKEHQMLVAILLILWVSAIASSFIDNIPFTTATIPVIWELATSPELCLSIRPLVWALAMGACLGGNGTLIGASANVVCAGIAEQNGYKISFMSFLKIGFPMMLVTTFTTMIYLLICHIAFDWNITAETKTCVESALF